jgi:hypothetical protein
MATLQGEALCPGCRDLARKKITEEQMQVLRDLFPDEVIVRRCGRIFALTEDGARGYDHRLLIAMERMGLVEKEHAKFSDAYQLAWGGLRKLEQCLSLPPRELGGEMELLRPVISHAAHALNAMLRERVGFWSVGVGAGRGEIAEEGIARLADVALAVAGSARLHGAPLLRAASFAHIADTDLRDEDAPLCTKNAFLERELYVNRDIATPRLRSG